ncbi:hypothetical protein RhiirC2_716420 [Rhizophagus irregularis]|uniref:SHSP domain-containing protein n=1 Tax=Rhizophagus irregularis TaxID=588596 RepID=A0A2N1MRG8_9GLOM|nr:hypothetical protein RhiirC2_716420 [Rhizophagus irregularis]
MPVYRRAVPIITPFVEAVPSDSNKRMCCGKAELSVLIAGAIVNISNTELELWLREATSLPFEHIVKKIEKGWGHVHFRTYDDASKFFHEMKERNFTGPNNCVIKFSASMYFKTRKLINYCITETESSTLPSDTNNPPPSDMNNQIPPPSETNNQIPPPSETNNQIPPPPSETNNQIPPPPSETNNQILAPPSETNNQISDKTQYVIYENNEGFYIIKIYTPGVQRKEQVQIEVSYDDRSITITAESSMIIGFNDCTIIENNIQTRFRVDIIFPRMINTDHPVRVDVEHGITTAMFNIKSNKRKIQII